MLTLKASVAATILAGAIGATAGVTYVATKANMQVSLSCPPLTAPSAENRTVPLGGPPLSTDQGKKW